MEFHLNDQISKTLRLQQDNKIGDLPTTMSLVFPQTLEVFVGVILLQIQQTLCGKQLGRLY